jgi:hypothetical protein
MEREQEILDKSIKEFQRVAKDSPPLVFDSPEKEDSKTTWRIVFHEMGSHFSYFSSTIFLTLAGVGTSTLGKLIKNNDWMDQFEFDLLHYLGLFITTIGCITLMLIVVAAALTTIFDSLLSIKKSVMDFWRDLFED